MLKCVRNVEYITIFQQGYINNFAHPIITVHRACMSAARARIGLTVLSAHINPVRARTRANQYAPIVHLLINHPSFETSIGNGFL